MSEPKSRKLPVPAASMEIELNAEELLSLSRAGARVQHLPSTPVTSGVMRVRAAAQPKWIHAYWRSPAAWACAGVVLFVAIGAGYLAATSDQVQPTARLFAVRKSGVAAGSSPSTQSPHLEPVRFANPFDKREVFEFPPGTSVQDAHDAVAQRLLARAIERRAQNEYSPSAQRHATLALRTR